MATLTLIIPSPFRRSLQGSKIHCTVWRLPKHVLSSCTADTISSCFAKQDLCGRTLSHVWGVHQRLHKPLSAVGSGLEALITDPEKNAICVKNAKIVVESQDDDKMQVRVDITGKETQIIFEKALRNLACTAPPVPGFRREKRGPKRFLTTDSW